MLVLDEGALDLLGGLEAIGHLHAVGDAPHVDLRRRRALARMEAFGRQNDAELAVLPLDDIAFANRACDDFHVLVLRMSAACGLERARLAVRLRYCGAQHTDFAAKGQTDCSARRMALAGQIARLEAASPFWSKDRHADRRPRLSRARANHERAAALFRAQGFIEVEPAILQVSPGNEAHLHGFATEMIGPDGAARRAFLHTSPEFAMKKLLAAGEKRIFALVAGVPQSRARRAACARIHDARMVSRRRAAMRR